MPPRVAIVGIGRVGTALHRVLTERGWSVAMFHHTEISSVSPTGDIGGGGEDVSDAGVDLVLLCLPDAAVGRGAGALPRSDSWVVAHCAGSLGLEVLGDHPRTASLHPLVSVPTPEVGARRLPGAWFAVAGDPMVREIVALLGGTAVEVAARDRAAYHAAAAVASNHLVALLAEVERIASMSGLPLEAYLDLVLGTVENVSVQGVAGALTGPVERGDWDTVHAHLEAIGPAERDQYMAGLAATAALARRDVPWGRLLADLHGT